jgi:hypothetical protein
MFQIRFGSTEANVCTFLSLSIGVIKLTTQSVDSMMAQLEPHSLSFALYSYSGRGHCAAFLVVLISPTETDVTQMVIRTRVLLFSLSLWTCLHLHIPFLLPY